jgi:hypothetical protein
VQVPVPFATVHACPHVPQFLASFVRLVEQVVPEQAPIPAGHDTEPQFEFRQYGVPLVDGHTWPHVPQFEASLVVAVSQPLAGLPSQLAKPAAQLSTHVPPEHDDVAFTVLHATPHMPQFFASVWRFVSHPLDGVLSQSAKPELQVSMTHMPIEHLLVAFASVQAFMHEPQWLTSVFLSTSQPLAALPSQSAKPIAHVSTLQTPFEHTLVACGSMHTFVHEPQLLTSFSVSTSQPLAAMPSQFPKPAEQLPTSHMPALHFGFACRSEHAFAHIPQSSLLTLVLTSQPSAESPLQSPYGAMHGPRMHTPPEHAGIAFGNAEQSDAIWQA